MFGDTPVSRGRKLLAVSVVLLTLGALALGSTSIAAQQDKFDVTLNCAIEAGNIGYAFKTYVVPWAEKQGIKFDLTEFPTADMYSLLLTNFVAGGGTYDIFMTMLNYRGDFMGGGFCYPLDDLMKKYGYPDEADMLKPYRELQKWGGKTYSLVIDGDMRSLYYRKDLFGDPKLQAEFKSKFGYDLKPPETWDQFLDVAKFFTRDTNGDGKVDMWGTAFMGVRPRNHWEYLDRWMAYNNPDPQYFDPETMEPRINNAGSIKALDNLVELVKYCPPGVLSYEWRETIDDWQGGRIAMVMQWGDGYMFASDPKVSKIAGKVGCAPPPGVLTEKGTVYRRALLAANWSVSLTSTVPKDKLEAAYSVIRYMNGKEGSLKIVTDANTACSPFRYSHYSSSKFRNLFGDTGEFLDNYGACVEIGFPDLHVPGASRFTDALALAVAKACSGEATPKQALDECAKAWNASIKVLGKAQLRNIYRTSMGLPLLK